MVKRTACIQASFDFETHTGIDKGKSVTKAGASMPWIKVAEDVPYFITDNGDHWMPIGHNDAITWPDLAGIFQRKNIAAADSYFRTLTSNGITCIRLMLEYCQGENRYFEKPVGHFQPNMIRLWDDIFNLCEKYIIRILLTPYDTFWMRRRWAYHPYNIANNGPCNKRSQWLLCSATRDAIKQRLYFATERWGSSGALFAWDLWNEIRPAHGGNSSKGFYAFIQDIAGFLRQTELTLHGKAHPQTVSVFSPVLQKDKQIAESTFCHPALDFATIHLYEKNSIDNPKNSIDAAVSTGRLTREVLDLINDDRPFFDSEHGPIKSFKDSGKSLPEFFDDEYFRHMQWAHFSSGAAGGGLRWPYRHPHTLTAGMRRAQLALHLFLPLIKWEQFHRVNLNDEIELTDPALRAFGCGDSRQAILWLLRINAVARNKMLRRDAQAEPSHALIPWLMKGRYFITLWNTELGYAIDSFTLDCPGSRLRLPLPAVKTDMAIAIVFEP